jgi:phage tail-like protein
MTGKTSDSIWPVSSAYFLVTFGSSGVSAAFQEIKGLDAESSPIANGDNRIPRFKMPGLIPPARLTLRRGTIRNDETNLSWFKAGSGKGMERETVTIRLMDEQGKPTMTWTLRNAWLVKILGTDKNGEADEFVVDTLELCYEGMTMTTD